ncbi:MAG: polysaccharide deacetylase family protein [Christensenella sp.]
MGFDMDGDSIWYNKIKNLPNGSKFIKGPSIGQYGPKKGALRILDILNEYELKSTWFIPSDMIIKYSDVVEKILLNGHEIAHHGLDHSGQYGATADEQIEKIEQCQEIFMKYTGSLARGFRQTGYLFAETERWIYGDGGFLYSSAGTSGEKCEFYKIEGVETSAVTIPCRDEQTDDYVQTVFHNYPPVLEGMPRIAAYSCVYDNWIREVEGAVRYGNSGSTAFHPQVAGTPGRAIMLQKFCEYLASNTDVWSVPCIEIAKHYKSVMGG